MIVGRLSGDNDSIRLLRIGLRQCHRGCRAALLTIFLLAAIAVSSIAVQAESGKEETVRLVSQQAKVESAVAERCMDIRIEEDIQCYKDAINRFLQSWLIAWGKGDIEAYLDHYVKGASPKFQLTAVEWEEERHRLVAGRDGMIITLELVSMMVNEYGVTEVDFTQSYRSPEYSDQVAKKLSLVRRGGGFGILREQTLLQSK